MSAELIAIRLGTALVGRAAHLLLAKQQGDQDRRSDMDGLIRRYIPGLRPQRSVQRQFEQIADSVADRLEPMLTHEFRGMDAGEHAAVVDAVIDAFENADLSDKVIFESNADSAQLARRIREAARPPVGLSAAGSALYEQLVAECCDCYVQIVRHLPVFTERAVAELLSRVDELGKDVREVLERLPKRSLYAPGGSDHDAAFRHEYLTLISRSLDEVELFSFAVEQPLRTKLSVAYVSLRVTTEPGGRWLRIPKDPALWRSPAPRTGIEAWQADEQETGGERVEAALSRKSRILLRGEAGSGKTTLLRWLATTAARASFTGELATWNGLVPVLLRLRSYASRELPKLHELLDDAAGLITSHMPNGWIDRLLTDGQILLLIDGVDELVPADRHRVREWITLLLHSYPTTRVVVTSRPIAARNDWLDEAGFAPVELERMTPTDLKAFIRQWHQAVEASGQRLPCPPLELPEYERALVASIQDRHHLLALATNPLLAAMLCSLHLSRNRQLPRNRMELYQIAVEMLVQRRDAERHIPAAQEVSLSLTDKLTVLRDLAWRLSDNNLNELDVVKATEYVTAKIASMRHLDVEPVRVMDYLLNRSGVLRSPAEGRIDFVHRTFQEYLAAGEAAAQDRMGNLISRAHLDAWRDTIIMAAGHANRSQRQELITGILELSVRNSANRREMCLLAASCMETIESISGELADRLDKSIARLVPPRSYEEGVSLASVGESILHHLPKTLGQLRSEEVSATIRTVAQIGGTAALRLLAAYAQDGRLTGQVALGEAWAYFDLDEYADQVLAKVPAEPGLRLQLVDPGQWKPATRLDNLKRLIIDYPTNLDDLAFGELPAVHVLRIKRLIGTNDLGALTVLPPDYPRHLTLNAVDSRVKAVNLATLATRTGLSTLELTGWEPLPPLTDVTLPTCLQSLGLGSVHPGYDLSFVVESGLRTLSLAGMHAHLPLAAVGCAAQLENLVLANCDLDAGFQPLPAVLPALQSLELRGTVLPYDLIFLADFPALTEIRLIDCIGPSNSAVNVASIPQPDPPRQLIVSVDGATRTTGAIASRDRIVYHRLPRGTTSD
ncbi:NACHT domain-containing protein [Nocardia iowensis]|uniref:NACHT domain-containing protein n=1 Tax=Nocardia iowensis TaxID=204891 RepID=A0ABX8RUV2_NOCIO|nr:NACHT domain-containing protein [Nocardia iowensis]QXN93419.1 NACHT domain-containing protein [Nocardia iowensis]